MAPKSMKTLSAASADARQALDFGSRQQPGPVIAIFAAPGRTGCALQSLAEMHEKLINNVFFHGRDEGQDDPFFAVLPT